MPTKIESIYTRGLLYSCGIIINKIVPESLFRFRIFNVYELVPADDWRTKPSASESEIMFRVCQSEDEFDAAQTLTHYRPSEHEFSDRASPKPTAMLAYDAAEPVGGVWQTYESFDETELGLRIRLSPSQRWLFAAYVSKSHRRRGIYRRLLNHAIADNEAATFASINPTNKASIAAHRPFASRRVGTCVAIRIFRWSTCVANGDLRVYRNEQPVELTIEA